MCAWTYKCAAQVSLKFWVCWKEKNECLQYQAQTHCRIVLPVFMKMLFLLCSPIVSCPNPQPSDGCGFFTAEFLKFCIMVHAPYMLLIQVIIKHEHKEDPVSFVNYWHPSRSKYMQHTLKRTSCWCMPSLQQHRSILIQFWHLLTCNDMRWSHNCITGLVL